MMPGIPLIYVISCELELIHDSCHFWTNHKITEEIKPIRNPQIKEAQTSMEPEQALIPMDGKSDQK